MPGLRDRAAIAASAAALCVLAGSASFAAAATSSAPISLNGTWSIGIHNCAKPAFVYASVKVEITHWNRTTGEFVEYLALRDPNALNVGSKEGAEDSGGSVRLYLFATGHGYKLYGLYYLYARQSGRTLTMTGSSGCTTITLKRLTPEGHRLLVTQGPGSVHVAAAHERK